MTLFSIHHELSFGHQNEIINFHEALSSLYPNYRGEKLPEANTDTSQASLSESYWKRLQIILRPISLRYTVPHSIAQFICLTEKKRLKLDPSFFERKWNHVISGFMSLLTIAERVLRCVLSVLFLFVNGPFAFYKNYEYNLMKDKWPYYLENGFLPEELARLSPTELVILENLVFMELKGCAHEFLDLLFSCLVPLTSFASVFVDCTRFSSFLRDWYIDRLDRESAHVRQIKKIDDIFLALNKHLMRPL
ncbi:MAG: hypothetical protein ACOVOR_04325 [Rhabdochlamydiaceae bacterium]